MRYLCLSSVGVLPRRRGAARPSALGLGFFLQQQRDASCDLASIELNACSYIVGTCGVNARNLAGTRPIFISAEILLHFLKLLRYRGISIMPPRKLKEKRKAPIRGRIIRHHP